MVRATRKIALNKLFNIGPVFFILKNSNEVDCLVFSMIAPLGFSVLFKKGPGESIKHVYKGSHETNGEVGFFLKIKERYEFQIRCNDPCDNFVNLSLFSFREDACWISYEASKSGLTTLKHKQIASPSTILIEPKIVLLWRWLKQILQRRLYDR